jgi:transcriptional regulator with XRE-family HTH domain
VSNNQSYNDPISLEITKISLAIKKLRKEKGYTSYENFALEFGLDRKQYWRVEEGANITLKTLLKILKCHDLTLKEFTNRFF